MLISGLIATLEAFKAEHGDLPVRHMRHGCNCSYRDDESDSPGVEIYDAQEPRKARDGRVIEDFPKRVMLTHC